MQIKVNSGNAFEADLAMDIESRQGRQQLIIQFPKDTAIEAIMANLVGAAHIEAIKGNGVRTVYEGYTKFRSLNATPDVEYLRLTLEKGDVANG